MFKQVMGNGRIGIFGMLIAILRVKTLAQLHKMSIMSLEMLGLASLSLMIKFLKHN